MVGQTGRVVAPTEALPVTALKGVGGALAAKLARLSIETVQDLLFLLPRDYEDRTQIAPIGSLRAGDRGTGANHL